MVGTRGEIEGDHRDDYFTIRFPAARNGYILITDALVDGIWHDPTYMGIAILSDNSSAAPPIITEQPQSAEVSPGSIVTLDINVTGSSPLTYQWYKDGTAIAGAVGSQLILKNFVAASTGSYTVKVSNSLGSVTSDAALLTLGEFDGFKIARTTQVPVIGNFDGSVWANVTEYELANKVIGSAAPENHSGAVKALWDDDNLYLLYNIKDDVRVPIGLYGPEGDDVQGATVKETKHNATGGIVYNTQEHSEGYSIEVKIPWSTVGIEPQVNQTIGFDAASDDMDSDGIPRKSKIAWHTTSNELWHDPTYMGVAMLVDVSDTAPPTTTFTGNAGTYSIDQTIQIVCTAQDPESGLAGSTCQDIVGPAYTFSVGENSFTATATDNAGNTAQATVSFNVELDYDGVIELVKQFIPHGGTANSFIVKLEQAKKDISKGKQPNKSFINELNAQSGKKVTKEHADILKALAIIIFNR